MSVRLLDLFSERPPAATSCVGCLFLFYLCLSDVLNEEIDDQVGDFSRVTSSVVSKKNESDDDFSDLLDATSQYPWATSMSGYVRLLAHQLAFQLCKSNRTTMRHLRDLRTNRASFRDGMPHQEMRMYVAIELVLVGVDYIAQVSVD